MNEAAADGYLNEQTVLKLSPSVELKTVFINPSPERVAPSTYIALSATKISVTYCCVGSVTACGLGYTFQVVAQKHAEPTVASLLMSLESVFAVVAGAILLHESMSGRELLGCAVIFAAVIISQLPEKKGKEGEA